MIIIISPAHWLPKEVGRFDREKQSWDIGWTTITCVHKYRLLCAFNRYTPISTHWHRKLFAVQSPLSIGTWNRSSTIQPHHLHHRRFHLRETVAPRWWLHFNTPTSEHSGVKLHLGPRWPVYIYIMFQWNSPILFEKKSDQKKPWQWREWWCVVVMFWPGFHSCHSVGIAPCWNLVPWILSGRPADLWEEQGLENDKSTLDLHWHKR